MQSNRRTSDLRHSLSLLANTNGYESVAVDEQGVKTRYITLGSGSPLVLLHGTLSCGLIWHPLFAELSKSFRLIVPDIIGFGESDKPFMIYDRPAYVGWLNRFLKAIRVPTTAILGNSLGGAIALEYSISYPRNITSLILSNSIGLSNPRAPSFRYLRALLLLHLYPRFVRSETAKVVWQAASTSIDLDSEVNDMMSAYILAKLGERGAKRPFWLGQTPATRRFAPSELSRVACPTLLIQGMKDSILDSNATIQASKGVPNIQVRKLLDAGHAAFLDEPSLFCLYVNEFLANHAYRNR